MSVHSWNDKLIHGSPTCRFCGAPTTFRHISQWYCRVNKAWYRANLEVIAMAADHERSPVLSSLFFFSFLDGEGGGWGGASNFIICLSIRPASEGGVQLPE